ncbi:MAG: ZIP family metal transporter [Firmicutes bacterium]|nr:ZIP family metal transporter [Bacillota bacterium]
MGTDLGGTPDAVVFGLLSASAAANIAGGLLILLRKDWPKKVLQYFIAVSAGFLLGTAVLDLVPASLSLDPAYAMYILLGFALIHIFEQVFAGHVHQREELRDPHPDPAGRRRTHPAMHPHSDPGRSRDATTLAAFLGLLVHTFLDGASIAAGFELSTKLGLLVFGAVILHKLPDGFTIASIMLAGDRPRKVAAWTTVALGVSTILGGTTIVAIRGINPNVVGVALALSAGVFLYVSASDLIPHVSESRDRGVPAFVFVGMAMVFGLSALLKTVGAG